MQLRVCLEHFSTSNVMLTTQQLLVVTAILAAMPMLVHAQCNFNPGCTIGPRQRCPTGCSRTEFCTKTTISTSTKTLPASTTTTTKTVTKTVIQVSTITEKASGSIITVTATPSASTITVTASTNSSSTAPPQCATEVPYANLFAFPDTKCKNTTNFLGPIPLTIGGLVSPPVKFNALIPNPEPKYNESSCMTLPTAIDLANSIYFTVDGYPKNSPFPSCTINMYKDNLCKGSDGQGTPDERFIKNQADRCLTAGTNQGVPRGPWNSAQFKCAYLRDLCTENEIRFGICIKY